MVVAGGGDSHSQNQAGEHGADQGQKDVVSNQIEDTGSDALPKARQGDHADDDAGGGTRGGDADDASACLGQGLENLEEGDSGVLSQIRDNQADETAVQGAAGDGQTAEHEVDDAGKRKDQMSLCPQQRKQSWQLLPWSSLQPKPFRLKMDTDPDADEIE